MEIRNATDVREADLVSMATQGNLEAFNQLVLKYQDLLFSVARSILGDDDSAQDAAQETLISALEHVARFRGGSFRGWLLRSTTNACYDFLRAQQRRPTVPLYPKDAHGNHIESPPWLADPHRSAQDKVESDEFSQTVFHWLDELPAQFRSVITLIDLNGIDYAEAAEALSIPVGTVKSRLARGRLRMKERLSHDHNFASASRIRNAGVPAI